MIKYQQVPLTIDLQSRILGTLSGSDMQLVRECVNAHANEYSFDALNARMKSKEPKSDPKKFLAQAETSERLADDLVTFLRVLDTISSRTYTFHKSQLI